MSSNEWMNEWMNESLLFQYGSFSSVSKIGLALLGFVNGKKFLRCIFNQSAALPCTCSPGLDAGLASVLCVVTQRLSPYELRHDTKNGCKSIDSQYSCWWHCYAWDTFLLRVSEWNQFTSSQFSCGSAAYETCFQSESDRLFLVFIVSVQSCLCSVLRATRACWRGEDGRKRNWAESWWGCGHDSRWTIMNSFTYQSKKK